MLGLETLSEPVRFIDFVVRLIPWKSLYDKIMSSTGTVRVM